MIVSLFGHRNTPSTIRPTLEKTLIHLMENENANLFYVGNHGSFDQLVRSVLKQLSKRYPHISYSVVLAYMPGHINKDSYEDYSDTILPEKAATSIPKFAISARNRWMLEQSDVVITYVKHSYGGAWTMKKSALAKKKRVIEISEIIGNL